MRGRSSAKSPERIARSGASGRASTSVSGPFARFASQSPPAGARRTRRPPRTPRRRHRSPARSRGLRRRRADRRRRRRPAYGRARTAAIESTPEPQPRSSTEPSAGRSQSSSRQPVVVACAPEPNAWPCSITTASAPCLGLLARRTDPEAAADQRAVVILAPHAGAHVLDRLDAPRAQVGRQRQWRRRVGGDLELAARIAHLLDPPGEEGAHALAQELVGEGSATA